MSPADRTSLDPSFVSESTSHQGHDTTRYPTRHLNNSTEGSGSHDPSLTQMQWIEQADDSDLSHSVIFCKGYRTVGPAEILPQAQFLVQQGFSPPDYPVPDIIPEGTDYRGHHRPFDHWDTSCNQNSFSHAWQSTFQEQVSSWQMGLQQQQDIWEGGATNTCETLPILMT